MSVLVTDTGFGPAPDIETVGLAELASHKGALLLAHTDAPDAVQPYLGALATIRVALPTFNDGRAFTIARRLRALGFTGTLHAIGPVIADQYAMARRVGFDGVIIPDALAARQPESQWLARADWRENNYLSRLRA